MGVDGCDELKEYNTKAVHVAFRCEVVCGYIHGIYVSVCTFKARVAAIKMLFLRQPKISNLLKEFCMNTQFLEYITHTCIWYERCLCPIYFSDINN